MVLGNFTDLQSTVNVQERAHHDHPVFLLCVEIVVVVGNRSWIFFLVRPCSVSSQSMWIACDLVGLNPK